MGTAENKGIAMWRA